MNLLSDEELSALQHQSLQLQELTEHPGWQVFVDYVTFGAGMLGAKQQYLLSGHCKNPEDYQRYVGWAEGAKAVLNAPTFVREMSEKYTKAASGETTG